MNALWTIDASGSGGGSPATRTSTTGSRSERPSNRGKSKRALELVAGQKDFLPHEVGALQLLLAKSLVDVGRDRDRAAALAREAHDALRAGPPASKKRATEVAAWLLETGVIAE